MAATAKKPTALKLAREACARSESERWRLNLVLDEVLAGNRGKEFADPELPDHTVRVFLPRRADGGAICSTFAPAGQRPSTSVWGMEQAREIYRKMGWGDSTSESGRLRELIGRAISFADSEARKG